LPAGERLATLAGPTAVLGIKPQHTAGQHTPQTVYNLEVQGQHVFRVTSNGLLVHNSYADDIAKLAGDTAKKIFGRSPSSKILGKNLEAIGHARPANSAAHHIVAGTDRRAAAARRILQREGIDINEAANGVFLPRSSSVARPPATTHSRLHTNRYYEALNDRLQRAVPGTVKQQLQRIADELANGRFPF